MSTAIQACVNLLRSLTDHFHKDVTGVYDNGIMMSKFR